MIKNSGIDVVRNVWCAEYEPLVVRPSSDTPGYVSLVAEGEGPMTFWGPVLLTLPAEMARLLGEALIACAKEAA